MRVIGLQIYLYRSDTNKINVYTVNYIEENHMPQGFVIDLYICRYVLLKIKFNNTKQVPNYTLWIKCNDKRHKNAI